MSDINTYANQAAIDGLSPIVGDLVVNRETNALHLCTAINPDVWKIFTNDSAAIGYIEIDLFGAEATIFADTTQEIGTVALSDEGNILVWNGSAWYTFNFDS
jgi:hypothetical protein